MPLFTARQLILFQQARANVDLSYLQAMLLMERPAGFDFAKLSSVIDIARVVQFYRLSRARSLQFREQELLEIVRVAELQSPGFIDSLSILRWCNFYGLCRSVGVTTDDTYAWANINTIGMAINWSTHAGVIPVAPYVMDMLDRAVRSNSGRCPECRSTLHARLSDTRERCEFCGRERDVSSAVTVARQRGRTVPTSTPPPASFRINARTTGTSTDAFQIYAETQNPRFDVGEEQE